MLMAKLVIDILDRMWLKALSRIPRFLVHYRDTWTDEDFADMGWHDSVVYSMSFPQADRLLKFDIDYIFEWHWRHEVLHGWDVAPCSLEFHHVSNPKVLLTWGIRGDTTIMDITRSNPRQTPNGELMEWDYLIELDVGNLSFTATGFVQTVRRAPVFSDSQYLGRP